jgi:hypothetical protein
MADSLEVRVKRLEQNESGQGNYENCIRALLPLLRNPAKGQEADESIVQLLLPHEKLLGPHVDESGLITYEGLGILINLLKK